MWTCPLCQQSFTNNNQVHSCRDRVLADALKNKSEHTIALFWHFIRKYQQIGDITVQPTKTMIAIAGKKRIVYITSLGKDFIDIVFPFAEACEDNLCFTKIARVPGSKQFNHHFRMYREENINDEVLHFMKLAFDENQ